MNELIITLAFGLVAILAAIVSPYFQLQRDKPDVPASTPDDESTQAVLDTVVHIIVPDVIPEQVGADAGAGEEPEAGAALALSFPIAHAPVARIEGGYQRYKEDSGNYNRHGQLVGTNWGISAKVAEEYFKRVVSRADMEKLSITVAMDIYKIKFWDRIRAAEYGDQQLANLVYDGAVNHGVSWGVRLLQRSLGLREDGVVGPITLAAIRKKDPQQLYYAYFTARRNFYLAIVANRPNQKVFLRGWMNRLEHYRHYQDA